MERTEARRTIAAEVVGRCRATPRASMNEIHADAFSAGFGVVVLRQRDLQVFVTDFSDVSTPLNKNSRHAEAA